MVGLMERKKHRQVSFIISLCRVNKSVCDTDIVSLWRSACHLLAPSSLYSWVLSKKLLRGRHFPWLQSSEAAKIFLKGHITGWGGAAG